MSKLIRDYILAIPTIVLSLLSLVSWFSVVAIYLDGQISFQNALLLCALFGYINFTPMHEAAHGNICGRHKSYKNLEILIGHLSAFTLFIPFSIFKLLHLRHHSFTNVKEHDPDYWVATCNPLLLLLKCLTIKLSYYYHAIFRPTKAIREKWPSMFMSLALYFTLLFFAWSFDLGMQLFELWITSAIIAMAMLAFGFDWLPHTPHSGIGRYQDTVIIDKKWLTIPLLFQNYHLIHHLYPRVPFYRYKKVYGEIQEELITNNSRIIK